MTNSYILCRVTNYPAFIV